MNAKLGAAMDVWREAAKKLKRAQEQQRAAETELRQAEVDQAQNVEAAYNEYLRVMRAGAERRKVLRDQARLWYDMVMSQVLEVNEAYAAVLEATAEITEKLP